MGVVDRADVGGTVARSQNIMFIEHNVLMT